MWVVCAQGRKQNIVENCTFNGVIRVVYKKYADNEAHCRKLDVWQYIM